jgi:polyhydroxybutyrate depolymerase
VTERLCILCLAGLIAVPAFATDTLGPGDHTRTIEVDGRNRSYIVHVPEKYDPTTPTPVVLVFHGAGTNARMMVSFCAMSKKSDEAGFITVYPNGTGAAGIFLTWNAGGLHGKMAEGKADDVKFVGSLLDDLATVANVDPKRVYATGMSNGGMMCYRLAAELSGRIAAIAPVAGTMAIAEAKPNRPVPVMHFHGTADRIVPCGGPGKGTPPFLSFKSVEETINIWAKLNRCEEEPVVEKLEDKADDGTTVTKKTYASKKDGAEVVLVEIEGGGHTWPGVEPPLQFIGKSTKDISANDMMWEFFQRHRLP